nr:2-C-methyl-D-erythritol 4-phosphate cytidylyltransferase [Ktedonobacterales bacterium]
IVLGAGQGTRMGTERNKIFLPLRGQPVLVHALAAFERAPGVDEILLVAHPREVEYCETEIVQRYQLTKVRGVIAGGASRHQSEARALAALRPRIEAGAIALILIHDGARPLVTLEEIARVLAAARRTGGALLVGGVAADETILEVAEDGLVRATYPAGELARAQTPQAFAAALLLAAYDAADAQGFEGTDTAAAVERLGHAVAVVRGGDRNLKITTPDDLPRAEALLAEDAPDA